jgi:hypothetical protein
MQPSRFLELAKRLAGAGGSAECRSAISRAYFAVFNSADQMERNQGSDRKGEHHRD